MEPSEHIFYETETEGRWIQFLTNFSRTDLGQMFSVCGGQMYFQFFASDISWLLFVVGWVRFKGVLVERWPALEEAAISASRVTSSF